MTALSADRALKTERWAYQTFTLASGKIAYKGGLCAMNIGVGTVQPATGAPGEFIIGVFSDPKVDATSAAKPVLIDLRREIDVVWFVNGNSLAAADLCGLAYAVDDTTVSNVPQTAGASLVGRIWATDSVRGVAVEVLRDSVAGMGSLAKAATFAFTSNNYNVPALPVSGQLYDIPATGAASTVTLPASAREGTVLYFAADGTKNNQTVQYVDATGSTNLTTALTLSKRHLVICTFLGTRWNANAYVGP